MVRKHVVLTGRVQGVSFRWATQQLAERAGVAGWVRNRPDGGVEAVFEGEPEDVEQLLVFCREGPVGAEVDELAVTDEPPAHERGFHVLG
jgi:acylphosphatase